MPQDKRVLITSNFEHNLESIRCYFHQHNHPEKFDHLLDTLFETIIPNLQSHPMIGFNFLAQKVNSLEELKLTEKIKSPLPDNSSIRQYNDRNYLVLYSLQSTEIILLSIKHRQQMTYDLRGIDE